MEKNKKAVIQQQRNSYKTYSKAYDAMVLCQEKVQVKCAQFPRSCRPGQPARAATDSAIVVRYSASY